MYLVYDTADQDTKNQNYLKLSEFCSFIRPQANQKQKNSIAFKMLSLDADHHSVRNNIHDSENADENLQTSVSQIPREYFIIFYFIIFPH